MFCICSFTQNVWLWVSSLQRTNAVLYSLCILSSHLHVKTWISLYYELWLLGYWRCFMMKFLTFSGCYLKCGLLTLLYIRFSQFTLFVIEYWCVVYLLFSIFELICKSVISTITWNLIYQICIWFLLMWRLVEQSDQKSCGFSSTEHAHITVISLFINCQQRWTKYGGLSQQRWRRQKVTMTFIVWICCLSHMKFRHKNDLVRFRKINILLGLKSVSLCYVHHVKYVPYMTYMTWNWPNLLQVWTFSLFILRCLTLFSLYIFIFYRRQYVGGNCCEGKDFLKYWSWNSDGKPWDSWVSSCSACRSGTTPRGSLSIW